jgi:hypothetical protein
MRYLLPGFPFPMFSTDRYRGQDRGHRKPCRKLYSEHRNLIRCLAVIYSQAHHKYLKEAVAWKCLNCETSFLRHSNVFRTLDPGLFNVYSPIYPHLLPLGVLSLKLYFSSALLSTLSNVLHGYRRSPSQSGLMVNVTRSHNSILLPLMSFFPAFLVCPTTYSTACYLLTALFPHRMRDCSRKHVPFSDL